MNWYRNLPLTWFNMTSADNVNEVETKIIYPTYKNTQNVPIFNWFINVDNLDESCATVEMLNAKCLITEKNISQ